MGKVIDITSRLKTINTDRLKSTEKQKEEILNRKHNNVGYIGEISLDEILKRMNKFYK